MSRTDKDRPYDVQVNDLRAEGKVRDYTYIAGSLGDTRTSPYPNRSLTKVFLKGDLEGIKSHRELLAGKDVTVEEKEFKLRVFNIGCTAEGEDHHEHDEEVIFQAEHNYYDKLPANDLFPVYKMWPRPACCLPVRRMTRTCVAFTVYDNYTPTVEVRVIDDYDSRLLTLGSRHHSKTDNTERRRRTKTRSGLNHLRRSRNVEDDWDDDRYDLAVDVRRPDWD